jgi:hypothetical protein
LAPSPYNGENGGKIREHPPSRNHLYDAKAHKISLLPSLSRKRSQL